MNTWHFAWQCELTACYQTTTVAGAYSSLGCLSDHVTLSCPAGRTINATSAVYGQYIYPHGSACPNDCCPPNPVYDCTELVYDNSPQDWLAIKLLCDGQESCEFNYVGTGFSDSCDVGNFADYIQVFYNCLPRECSAHDAFFSLICIPYFKTMLHFKLYAIITSCNLSHGVF